MPSRSLRNNKLIAGVAVVVVLVVSLGVGLGVGLKHDDNDAASSTKAATASSASAANTSLWGDYSNTFIPRTSLVNSSDFSLSAPWDASDPPKTREFNWTVSEVWSNPGAIWKTMIVVNGQSPGPTIHANIGDRLLINVHNALTTNSTTVHWHGLHHAGTNFMDGTQSITQCGIPPGQSFTYNFTLNQDAMTTWWHSHSGTQYADGMFGGLVLHSANETAAFAPNSTTPAYEGEELFLLGDVYNTFSPELYWRYMLPGTGMDGQPGDEPVPDGGHINGISQSTCAYYPATNEVIPEKRRSLVAPRNPGDGKFTQYPSNLTCADNNTISSLTYFNTTLERGKTYRLRLANVGTFANVQFSIDNHTLTVVEAEGTSIEPVEVQSLTLAVAQRYSVLVTLDQTPGPYWIRSVLDESMFTYDNPGVQTLTQAVLRYNGTDPSALPRNIDAPSIAGVKSSLDISNVGGDLVPSDVRVPPSSTQTNTVSFSLQYTTEGQYLAFFNSTSFTALPSGHSSLLDFSAAQLAGEAYHDDTQLIVNSTGTQVFDLIVNSLDDGQHPFHLHGHTFWIMDSGKGSFVSSSFNATNPMRRDTLLLDPYSWVALRFVTDNPGLWAFHCHLSLSHQKAGLLMQIASVPSSVSFQQLIDDIPQALRDQCAYYNATKIDTSTLAEVEEASKGRRRLPRSPLLLGPVQ